MKLKILFLCTGNSCRSQMAEGYARHFGRDFLEVVSAGIEAHGINSFAIDVMKEDGVDITSQQSTQLTSEILKQTDLVITLCGDAEEKCPFLPEGVIKYHWPIEDPAKISGNNQQILTHFRLVRDKIKTLINNLVAELRMRHHN